MRVTILGHASLFFEAGEHRVLLDPVLRTTPLMGSLVHQYPRELDLARMPELTLVVITHAHFDHYDMETLGKLPKSLPIMIPTDKRMARELTALGFTNLLRTSAWEVVEHGPFRFMATPSDAPVVEFGILAETSGARLWHMSDAEASPEAAARIVSERGAVDVLTVKFQPADPQLNFQHNMGSSFDRRAVASWLETGCAVAPKLAFPYASGLCFDGDRAWLNRYAYPFSAEHIAQLLERRLGASGAAFVARPGDVIAIEDHRPRVSPQSSPFVRQARAETPTDWEPFDETLLVGLGSADRAQFAHEAEKIILEGEFTSWLEKHTSGDTGLLRAFRKWQVVGQLVLHLGDGQRAEYVLDFSQDRPAVTRGRAVSANYFTHVGADGARRLLAGAATPLEVMIEGSVRIHERIITLRDGHFDAPATPRIYEEFPDPFVSFGGVRRRSAKVAGAQTGGD